MDEKHRVKLTEAIKLIEEVLSELPEGNTQSDTQFNTLHDVLVELDQVVNPLEV